MMSVSAFARRLPLVLAAVVAATVGAAVPAHADDRQATGRVLVFATELTEVSVYQDPAGCQRLPVGAHVLINFTDREVRVYAARGCHGPSIAVGPRYGSHVSPVGSFAAQDS